MNAGSLWVQPTKEHSEKQEANVHFWLLCYLMILRFAWANQVLTLITGTDLLGINVRGFFLLIHSFH